MRPSLSDCVTRLLRILWQDSSPEASLQESPLHTPCIALMLYSDLPSLNHCFFTDFTLSGTSYRSPSPSTSTNTIHQFSYARSIGHVPHHVHSIDGGQFDFRQLTYTKVNPIPSVRTLPTQNPAFTPRSSLCSAALLSWSQTMTSLVCTVLNQSVTLVDRTYTNLVFCSSYFRTRGRMQSTHSASMITFSSHSSYRAEL
ncbi:hypothetical protein HZ326_15457 [Fusarium oxysporum f. sp. albedinis]|nr:hypothetical protein HZ326_15457 [Fusarium oxysporum f. sp. albedinis]